MVKKRRKQCVLLCLVFCILVLAGCGRGKGSGAGSLCVYYLDTEEMQLAGEYYDTEAESVEGKIEEILKLLGEQPDANECRSVFVGGVEPVKWELQETKLNLYFNKKYRKLDPASEVLLRAAVVQSLVQIPGVDYICFFVDGEPLEEESGKEIGYMRAEDFVQNTGSSLHTYQTANLTLYFSNSKGDKLAAEEVSVRYNSNTSVEKLIVEQLIKGPSVAEDKAVIPAGTRILGVSVRDNVCYVNFDEGFLNVAEQVNPKVTVYALVNSIVEGGEVNQVQILVNGETNITYQETIDLSKPFSKDSDMIEAKED